MSLFCNTVRCFEKMPRHCIIIINKFGRKVGHLFPDCYHSYNLNSLSSVPKVCFLVDLLVSAFFFCCCFGDSCTIFREQVLQSSLRKICVRFLNPFSLQLEWTFLVMICYTAVRLTSLASGVRLSKVPNPVKWKYWTWCNNFS